MTQIHAEPGAARRLQPRAGAPVRLDTLSVAYTPDSDDAFNFYAWEHGIVTIPGVRAQFHRAHISDLNHAAAAGLHHVVAVSSVMYPGLADRHWILSAGNSVGRGYGPVLASARYERLEDLAGKRIGVAEISTTGGALAAMYCPGATLTPVRYDKIADAVARGELDAGVMIHEELLFFPEKGLRRVCDLGAVWCEDTGLPLPVGLNLVRKEVGRATAREIARACRDSLLHAQEHYDEAFAFAGGFGRGCAEQHIRMFSNADTLCLPGDARRAVRLMCERIAAMGLGPRLERPEFIDA